MHTEHSTNARVSDVNSYQVCAEHLILTTGVSQMAHCENCRLRKSRADFLEQL